MLSTPIDFRCSNVAKGNQLADNVSDAREACVLVYNEE
jgi:hypothetical protein